MICKGSSPHQKKTFNLQHVSRTEGDIQLEGANASAEEFDEGTVGFSVLYTVPFT